MYFDKKQDPKLFYFYKEFLKLLDRFSQDFSSIFRNDVNSKKYFSSDLFIEEELSFQHKRDLSLHYIQLLGLLGKLSILFPCDVPEFKLASAVNNLSAFESPSFLEEDYNKYKSQLDLRKNRLYTQEKRKLKGLENQKNGKIQNLEKPEEKILRKKRVLELSIIEDSKKQFHNSKNISKILKKIAQLEKEKYELTEKFREFYEYSENKSQKLEKYIEKFEKLSIESTKKDFELTIFKKKLGKKFEISKNNCITQNIMMKNLENFDEELVEQFRNMQSRQETQAIYKNSQDINLKYFFNDSICPSNLDNRTKINFSNYDDEIENKNLKLQNNSKRILNSLKRIVKNLLNYVQDIKIHKIVSINKNEIDSSKYITKELEHQEKIVKDLLQYIENLRIYPIFDKKQKIQISVKGQTELSKNFSDSLNVQQLDVRDMKMQNKKLCENLFVIQNDIINFTKNFSKDNLENFTSLEKQKFYEIFDIIQIIFIYHKKLCFYYSLLDEGSKQKLLDWKLNELIDDISNFFSDINENSAKFIDNVLVENRKKFFLLSSRLDNFIKSNQFSKGKIISEYNDVKIIEFSSFEEKIVRVELYSYDPIEFSGETVNSSALIFGDSIILESEIA
ncbi:MAG: hypothetical protein ISN64_03730 [Rickettsia sp.]|nr:hypothetical protein [Rickettsia sp.]